MNVTEKQVVVLQRVLSAMLEAIEAAGTEGIPAGHMYATLMGQMSLDQFHRLCDILVESGRITNANYLLRAVQRG